MESLRASFSLITLFDHVDCRIEKNKKQWCIMKSNIMQSKQILEIVSIVSSMQENDMDSLDGSDVKWCELNSAVAQSFARAFSSSWTSWVPRALRPQNFEAFPQFQKDTEPTELSLAISGYLSSLSSLNIFDIFHLQLHQLPRASQSSLCHVSRHRSYRFTLSAGLTRTAEGSAARTAEIVRLRERTCHRSKNPCTCIRWISIKS